MCLLSTASTIVTFFGFDIAFSSFSFFNELIEYKLVRRTDFGDDIIGFFFKFFSLIVYLKAFTAEILLLTVLPSQILVLTAFLSRDI